jgi:hypothetical protein
MDPPVEHISEHSLQLSRKKKREEANKNISTTLALVDDHAEELLKHKKDIYQLITMVEEFKKKLTFLEEGAVLADNQIAELEKEVTALRSTAIRVHPLLQSIQRIWATPKTPKGEEICDDTRQFYIELADILRSEDVKEQGWQDRMSILYGKIQKNIGLIRMLNTQGDDYLTPDSYNKNITSAESCDFKAMLDRGASSFDPAEPIHPQGNPGTNMVKEVLAAKSFVPFRIHPSKVELNNDKAAQMNLKNNAKNANIAEDATPTWKIQCITLGLESYEALQHHYRDDPDACPLFE